VKSSLVSSSHLPIGKGIPILFLNIATCADGEIWDLAIKEALKASHHLHVVLVHEMRRGFSKPSKNSGVNEGVQQSLSCIRQLKGRWKSSTANRQGDKESEEQ